MINDGESRPVIDKGALGYCFRPNSLAKYPRATDDVDDGVATWLINQPLPPVVVYP